jgi:ABC-2 type transport system ATP-binding protein
MGESSMAEPADPGVGVAVQGSMGQRPRSVEVRRLVKKFGGLTAVDGVSFDVEEGEIFGFLGPNGAGKSTTINMLCTLLKVTSGTARVGCFDIRTEPERVRAAIGLIFQDNSLDDRLTGLENLRFHAFLYDVPRSDFQERAERLLAMVDLADRANERVRSYSGGMRRRLEIARGLLHRPRVLFLDEPTIGLDPQTRRRIWEYLVELRNREGTTMFMTTHYMDEAETCDRIAIIDRGRIVALDTPERLKATVGGDVVTLRTSDDERAVGRLQAELGLDPRLAPDGGLIVEATSGETLIPRLMTTLSSGAEPVQTVSVNLRRPTLEDVFIKLTGRAIRDEEGSAMDRMRRHARMWRRR